MDEDAGIEVLRSLEDRVEGFVVKVAFIDVGPDLDAGKAQVLHAAFKFPDGHVRVLHGNCAKADEAVWMVVHSLGDVIIEDP